jgi:phosphoribosyl-ATP pyrophosphohydrolase
MQDYVHQSFERCGQLWNRTDILLKIAEELGELVQSFRKKDSDSHRHEFGDLVFSVFALAEREGFNINDQLCAAVVRFEKHCSCLVSNRIKEQDRDRINAGGYCETNAFGDTRDGLTPTSRMMYDLREARDLPELTDDYPYRCIDCNRQPTHKTNGLRVCPDCMAVHKPKIIHK